MRRGTDVLKAMALGADAVFLGRATLYGLAATMKSPTVAFMALSLSRILRPRVAPVCPG